jgi:hypothetical protein
LWLSLQVLSEAATRLSIPRAGFELQDSSIAQAKTGFERETRNA